MKKKIVSEDYSSEKQERKSNVNENKKTKNKSNAQKAIPIMIVVIVTLLIILTCTLIAYYQVNKTSRQTANILEGLYTSSYFSMVDNVNNLAVDISKYSTLGTKQAKLSTLHDMMTDCNYILSGLGVLPINQENVVSATKFFNQINGVCESYATVLNKNENLSREQELLFDEVGLVLGRIKDKFNEQNAGMYDTNFNFVDASIFDNTGMNELSSSLGDISSSAIEYPAMIFDGPFSTALETKVVKGLPESEVSEQDAKKYLQEKVFAGRKASIKSLGTTEGDIATFDFEITVANKKFNAQVSKCGGLLITASSYAEGGDPIMKEEQAREEAKTFANNIGFESMEAVWSEKHENVAYINLAPTIDGVIMYPDLVKVKVDLTSQEIIGFEAVNYALNHVEREVTFNVDSGEAEKLLGFDFEVLKTSKAVIKLDSGKEIATYEFIVERIDGVYYYYIDANKNEIAKTMKLVNIKNVEKLI